MNWLNIIETTSEKNADYGCHQAAIDAVKKAKWRKSSLAKLENSEAGFEFKIPTVFSLDKAAEDKTEQKYNTEDYSIVNYSNI